MKKLLVLLLSSALCFNNAFLTVQALDDDPVPGEEHIDEIDEGYEEPAPEGQVLEMDESETTETEPEETVAEAVEETAEVAAEAVAEAVEEAAKTEE